MTGARQVGGTPVLITVTGPDRPGVSSVLFAALTRHRVDLLDDGTAESAERFALKLSDAANATIVDGRAVAQIGVSDGTAATQPKITVANTSKKATEMELRITVPTAK